MGYRQSRRQVLARGARIGLSLCFFASCGGSASRAESPTPESIDAGPDQAEAEQINAIARAINEFGPAVHTCWARAAADDFRLEGQVVLSLELMGDGAARVSLSEDNTGDPVLVDCLLTLWSDYQWPLVFAAGDKIVLPPFEFVAPASQYSVASAHVPVHTLFAGKMQARIVADEANTGNSQAALTLITAKDGLTVPLHTHTSTEILFVLSGNATMHALGGDTKLGPGSALLIPTGAIHGFTQVGSEPIELLQFYAPGGPEAFYKDQSKQAGTTEHAGALPKKGPKPVVRDVANTKAIPIMAGLGEILLLLDETITKDPSAYVGALTVAPGGIVPPHRHSDSSEYLYVLEGQSQMLVAGRAVLIEAGDLVQIPPGVEHSASVTGTEPFKALQFYTPAGPEQRFRGSGK